MTASENFAKPRKVFLFGYPIAHSLSPLLQNTMWKKQGINWTYELYESKDADAFYQILRSDELIGAGITMPHKVTFCSKVDEISPEGRAIGSINTVYKRADDSGKVQLIGTNTDCYGIRYAFEKNIPGIEHETRGKAGMVIGGGGTTRAAAYALATWFGCSTIYLVNRFDSEIQEIIDHFGNSLASKLVAVTTPEQAAQLPTPAIVVGAVPDLEPQTGDEKRARSCVVEFLSRSDKGTILEMCYHPHPETRFFKLATSYGWRVIPGTEAMIYQGVEQQNLWNRQSVSPVVIDEVSAVIHEIVVKHA
jgi:quinate dehydrogenase